MRRARKPIQEALVFSRRGGKRKGAGRKPKGPKPGVPHVRRPSFSASTPIHVTVRVAKGVPNLRSRKAMRVLTKSIHIAHERLGMRLTQFSIQTNHIHLIVEAENRHALSRGMKGFSVRIARHLNIAFGRKGKVFDDRYHAHILRTPTEVRNAIRYVKENSRIHAQRRGEIWRQAIDRFAGGPCKKSFLPACRSLVAEPRSFLLRVAWNLPYLRRSSPPPAPPPLIHSTSTARPADDERMPAHWIVREPACTYAAEHLQRRAFSTNARLIRPIFGKSPLTPSISIKTLWMQRAPVFRYAA